ncbi:hypothetical protein [Accumulibacter sp.]|uniref:hypothetical protein n=1 Tax=Accumulibacter sp. TaxID=2053492 RepID=UPI0025CE33FA|nr:hypothetical protein [Accumulibacter sp.]MCM8612715.1 hypothetical protein [Accumulibacter sp.]MCM8637621.1 hypothetical protein [Accumulibacter sp.]MCM8639648.1 hypothetical protein [Accumulibacter sp.]
MNSPRRPPSDDPLYALPDAARPHYATGMLLDATDFADEQTYHRNRLARALAFASGAGARRLPPGSDPATAGATGLFAGGTLAGLRVRQVPATATSVEEIRIAPGLAVDRLGRLVELPRAVCLRVERWFDGELQRDGGDGLRLAALDDPGRFASARLLADGPALAPRAVIADVFIRFVTCRQALTPAFASGPFDALDAVQTARLRDAWEVHLVLRGDGLDDAFSGLPQQDRDLSALTAGERRAALHDAVLDGWPDLGASSAGAGELAPPPGHPPGLDPTAVFLARVFLAVAAGDPPQRDGDAVVDNGGRRVLPHLGLLAGAVGLGG